MDAGQASYIKAFQPVGVDFVLTSGIGISLLTYSLVRRRAASVTPMGRSRRDARRKLAPASLRLRAHQSYPGGVIDARFRSGDAVRGLRRAGVGDHASQREEPASDDPRRATPEAKVSSFERVPRLHATKQSWRFSCTQNLVVSLSSHTLGTRIRTVSGRRV